MKQESMKNVFRLGYVAKGIVYGLIGFVALRVIWASAADVEGARGVLQLVAGLPFGQWLLGILGLTLLGYVFWRFFQAVKDPDHKGTSMKGLASRFGYAASGLIYGSLAFAAVRAAFLQGGTGDGQNSQAGLVQTVLGWPAGQALVVIGGLVFCGVAIYHVFRAVTERFMREYRRDRMSREEERFARFSGKIGISARAAVFFVIGCFVTYAGFTQNPSEAKNTEGVLQYFLHQTYGDVLLTVVGLGFIAYSFYCFTRAKYRDFKNEEKRQISSPSGRHHAAA